MGKNKTKNSRDKKFIIIILLLAGVKVFIFNAIFPINNNVDEPAHLDMVCKYSTGRLPAKGLENYNRETLELLLLYGSPEYLFNPDLSPKNFLLLWKYPHVKETRDFQILLASRLDRINHETGSFPAYYLWAGLWWNLGKSIGLNGGNLIYLIRFLNVPVFMTMVWLAFLTAKTLFPDDSFLQKGLPIMAAALPQDMFYSISNDTISPLLFSLSFLMLMKILFKNKSLGFYFAAAVVIAITLLNKISNITMLALLGPVIIFKLRRTIAEKNFKENFFKLFVLVAVSIIPLCLWITRNYIVLGDITGTAAKNSYLGWTAKPFGQIWHHPIFTLGGIIYFLGSLTKTFWRGEFIWYSKIISSKIFDSFYIISTGLFLLVALVSLFRGERSRQRTIMGISFVLIAASVMMLAVLSVLYDYGECWYPSQEHPFFTPGRLIVTALVPFLILYLYGLQKTLIMLRLRFDPLILVVIIAVAVTLSEIVLSWNVFASPYNWFHLI